MKKGYDFVKKGGKFVDEACIELGVGRNMVNSIRFWLKSFGIIDLKTEKTTEIADFLFDDNSGKDKYLESETSLWLLHYLLVVNNYSSIYSIIFNNFRKLKPEFNKTNLSTYISELNSSINHNTLSKDFSVFLRTYHSKNGKDKEDSFSGLFSDLELVHEIKKKKDSSKFSILNHKEQTVSIELILFIILENKDYGNSISFKNLYSDFNSVGNIFAFNNNQLEKKLIRISEKYTDIMYSNDAGIKELQFKNGKPNSLQILKEYYE
ncbi:MAG: DUF4007 family protein [Polaribacter sp.]